jgi:hypothetical protein
MLRPVIREGAKDWQQLLVCRRQDALAVVALEEVSEKACSGYVEFEPPVLGAIVREDHSDDCNPHDLRRRRCVELKTRHAVLQRSWFSLLSELVHADARNHLPKRSGWTDGAGENQSPDAA